MIKKYLFKKYTYPELLRQLTNCLENKQIVFAFIESNDTLKLLMLLDSTITIFTKVRKGSFISKETIFIDKNLENMNITKELIYYIELLKVTGGAIQYAQIIDYINNIFKKYIAYYGMSRKEVSFLYENIILHPFILNDNIAPLVAPDYSWVD